jgi:hypothetical protein
LFPPLEAHDGIDLLGEQVGDLALALIAPLGADDHYSGHRATKSTWGLALSTGRSG